MNNIVKFPKDKRDSPPQSLEETLDRIKANRLTYSAEFCSDIMDILNSIFLNDNIDILDESLYYETELLKDALLSLHLKAHGINYYIQDVAADLYSSDEGDVEEILESDE